MSDDNACLSLVCNVPGVMIVLILSAHLFLLLDEA